MSCTPQLKVPGYAHVLISGSSDLKPGGHRSWSGYGPWLCCNHALVEGWSEYDAEACSHCQHRRAQVNPHTGMPKIVKGVPYQATRPTGGWTHGKGKAKKRLLLHSKRLQTQPAVSAAASPPAAVDRNSNLTVLSVRAANIATDKPCARRQEPHSEEPHPQHRLRLVDRRLA